MAYLAESVDAQTTPPQHIVAVMGVVRHVDGSLLLVRTPRRGWEPPGGQVEQGEDLISALEREVLEESGCTVRAGRLVGVYSNVSRPGKVMLTFLCDYVAGTLAPSAETPEVNFFAVDEALRLVTHPTQALKLHDALDDALGIIYRAYRTDPFALVTERRC